jgi:cytoskeletal protein CcmA (bactofilin family)
MLAYHVYLEGWQMAESQHSNIPAGEPNTLYVGQGVCVKGDLLVPGIVVVDGVIEGNVNGRAVWVSPSGVVKGTIVVTEAEIHGTISETIEVKQLLIVHATGRVLGDVRYGELQLEKGAVISGTLSCVSDQKDAAVESVLGKADRPKVVHRLEPSRPLNGAGNGAGNGAVNGAAPHGKLPPADYRAAS